MERRISAGLAAQEGRKFGRTVGIALTVLGGILFWRERLLLSLVFWAVGAVLIFAAIVAPAKLKPVERVWMGMAHRISRVTTPIVMGIVYFLVVTPIGFVIRRAKGNPLVHSAEGGSYWFERGNDSASRSDMRRQF